MRGTFAFPLALLLAVFLSLSGCQYVAPSATTVTDDAGQAITLRETPRRIVSLAPSQTELLFALGVDDRLVGVTDSCDYPPAAKDKPKMGAYYDTNVEAIVAANPDIILTDGHDPAGEKLRSLGRTVVTVKPKDLDGVLKSIQFVGTLVGQDQKARDIVAQFKSRMDAIVAKTSSADPKPTVFYVVDASSPKNPWTVGPGSFVDTLISLAGGRNIVQGGDDYLQYSMEQLVAADPDILVLDGHPLSTPAELTQHDVWKDLRAVKAGRVYSVSDPSLTSRPGPRLVDGLQELARVFHPSIFPAN